MSIDTVSIVIPCYRQAHSPVDCTRERLSSIKLCDRNDRCQRAGQTMILRRSPTHTVTAFGTSTSKTADYRRPEMRALLSQQGSTCISWILMMCLNPYAISWLVEAMEGHDDRLCVMGYRLFSSRPGDLDFTAVAPPVELKCPIQYFIQQNFGPPHCFLSARNAVIRAGGFQESCVGVPRTGTCGARASPAEG